MTNSWPEDIFYSPGDPLFQLRVTARSYRLTRRQRWILRRKWLKNWKKFTLFRPLY